MIFFLLVYLTGPIFDADNDMDLKLLTENKKNIHSLHKKFLNMMTVTVVTWFILFVLKKLQDENAFITSYYPFETKSWPGYVIELNVVWLQTK